MADVFLRQKQNISVVSHSMAAVLVVPSQMIIYCIMDQEKAVWFTQLAI